MGMGGYAFGRLVVGTERLGWARGTFDCFGLVGGGGTGRWVVFYSCRH